jgi:8-oxo-dGTP pyrophosphatase MutT (NUDIX family)
MAMSDVALSCGVLLLNAQGELLLCHATGTRRWDISKGGTDSAAESTLQTALRETAEETGLVLAPDGLLDLGRWRYRPGKDLYLYAALIERIDAAQCVCRTQFRDARGRLRPEMDAFAWLPFERAAERCGKSLAALLASLALPALLLRLRRADAGRRDAQGAAGETTTP